MPTAPQIALLFVAVALFVASGFFSVARLWWNTRAVQLAGKSGIYWGIATSIAVLIWHSLTRGRWMPIGDNFDALIWLAVLLAMFLVYVQATRPLAALDWIVLPIAVLLLICAIVFGRTEFHPYVGQTWTRVHRVASYSGFVAFAVAAAGGTLYLRASILLRRKQPVGNYLGSLERLEHLTKTAVTLGFALLTIGIITGLIELIFKGKTTQPTKVALAGSVWVIYAIVLHAPINPVFRGRRAAVLSVVGFVLMIGAILAAQFTSGGK